MLLFQNLKVLDVGTWIAGPVSTTILADFGADVIKVEIPDTGDPFRNLAYAPMTPDADVNYTWLMSARNKRSLTLNLKTEQGKDILHQLVAGCDVYVTNQPMGARRRLGLTYEELAPLNPQMIFASLTAYGEQGPEAEREGFDAQAYWTRSGLSELVRAPGAQPSTPVAGIGDHPTAVALFACIMMGLYKRQLTGEGGAVSTSLLANGFWANGCFGQAALVGGDCSARRHLTEADVPWMRALYATQDERYIQLAMVRYAEVQEHLFEVLELGHLLDDERFQTGWSRYEHSSELRSLLQQVFIQKSSDYWLRLLTEHNINVSRLAVVEDMLHDQQAIANNVLTQPDAEVDAPYVINPPLFVDKIDRVGPKRAPELGEHTVEILAELGLEDEVIAKLARRGVI